MLSWLFFNSIYENMNFNLPITAVAEAIKLKEFEMLPMTYSKFNIDQWDVKRGKNIEVSINEVSIEFIEAVSNIIKIETSKNLPYEKFSIAAAKRLDTKIRRFKKIASSESGKYEFGKISDIPALIKSWIEHTETMYTEIVDSEKIKLPLFKIDTKQHGEQIYVLTSVQFIKPRRDDYDKRPYVSFNFESEFLESKSTTNYVCYQLMFNKKSTISDIFDVFDIEYVDEEMYKEHLVDVELAKSFLSDVNVFDCIDSMQLLNGKIARPKKSKDKSSVVMDVNGYLNLRNDKYGSDRFYGNSTISSIPYNSIVSVKTPQQSIVCGYYLAGHQWFTSNVNNFKPYEFKGEKFMDNLIIPEEHKDMVKMIVDFDQDNIEDLIEGKSGGSFILAKGAAGLGKTLTAEVLSESVKRPLYEIQCSQLGVKVDDIEKKFTHILENSKRWNAILVINEADVYIRERGQDIEQNAIVGVFLRLLEKSNGIIFMTTNLDNIDDAIESRAMIVLKYDLPSDEEFMQIFKVLSNQYELSLSETFNSELLNHIQKLSKTGKMLTGRDAKQLCKLMKTYVQYSKKQLCEFTDFKMLLKYKS